MTTDEPQYPDDPGGSLVRSFMVTHGRTTSTEQELPLETVVTRTDTALQHLTTTRFERRQVLTMLNEPISIAEVAAKLSIPLRAAIILISEMAADGLLAPSDLVETVDNEFLMTVRKAIEAL